MDACLNDANYLHKVKLEHHLDCPNCVQKLKEALQAVPGIVSVTIPEKPDEPITAIVVGDETDVSDLDSILKEKTNLKVVVRVEQAKCHDESETVKDFNHEEFGNFCHSFNSEVAKSVAGTMGHLYKATCGGVVRVTFDDLDQKIQSQGTAFVVCKKKKVSILLTTAHTFSDILPSSSTYVVSSNFKHFKANVWHVSKEMDVCLLIVEGDLGPNVWELPYCDDVNFGEEIFSISCPGYQMSVEDPLFSGSNFKEHLLHTLWFSLSKGYVSHPFLVGVHERNLDGIFLQLHGANWGEGSSGAPIMNMQGRVIGMYLASTYSSDASNVNHWGLRLNSIRDYLEKFFKVSEERKGKNLKNLLWSCWKEMIAKRVIKRKRGRKEKSTLRRCSAEQQSGSADEEDATLDQPIKKVKGVGTLIPTDGSKPRLGQGPTKTFSKIDRKLLTSRARLPKIRRGKKKFFSKIDGKLYTSRLPKMNIWRGPSKTYLKIDGKLLTSRLPKMKIKRGTAKMFWLE